MYTPNANALAGALVPPERRGRAIAIVNAGPTVAIAIGVPLGAVVGNRLGWRMTFVGVAVMSAAAVVGLLVGLPARAGAGMVTATLRERVRVMTDLGWVGAACELGALTLFLKTRAATGTQGALAGEKASPCASI
jgi:predicted MFS family arabinose efflux permease